MQYKSKNTNTTRGGVGRLIGRAAGFLFGDLSKVITNLALVRLIGALGFSISMPFLAIYLHEELLVSMTLIGAMLTLSGIAGSIGAPIGGALSDGMGRRRLLVLLLIGRAGMFFFLGYLVASHKSFGWFSLFYIFAALMGTSIFPLMDAMVGDVTEQARRSHAYGLLRMAGNLGWAIGPAIGGLLVGAGYASLFWATGLMIVVSALLVKWTVPETLASGSSSREAYNPFRMMVADRALLLFLLLHILLGLVRGQLIATLSVYASGAIGLPKSSIGLLYMINGGMVATLQVLVTRWTARRSDLTMMGLAGVLYGVGYGSVGLANGWWALAGAMAVITIAEMIEMPTAASYVSSLAPEGRLGGYMGAHNLALHLGWTTGPLLGGLLLDHMPDPQPAWAIIAAVAVVSAAGFRLLGRPVKVAETGA